MAIIVIIVLLLSAPACGGEMTLPPAFIAHPPHPIPAAAAAAALRIRTRPALCAEAGGPKDVVRCFVLCNATAAHGIAEWGQVAGAPASPAAAAGGRLRTFEAFGGHGRVQATCTIAEVPYSEGGLGSKVWESSLALACWSLMNPGEVAGKNVLELGSGCGLGGVMVGAAGASKVTLSDFHGEHEQFVVTADGTLVSARQRQGTGLYSVDKGVYADESGAVSFPLLRNLRENLQRNSGRDMGREGERGVLSMATLDWSNPHDDLGTFDLVVGSDCIYAGGPARTLLWIHPSHRHTHPCPPCLHPSLVCQTLSLTLDLSPAPPIPLLSRAQKKQRSRLRQLHSSTWRLPDAPYSFLPPLARSP